MDFLKQELALQPIQTESPEAVKPLGRCTGTFFVARVASLHCLRTPTLPQSCDVVKDHWRSFLKTRFLAPQLFCSGQLAFSTTRASDSSLFTTNGRPLVENVGWPFEGMPGRGIPEQTLPSVALLFPRAKRANFPCRARLCPRARPRHWPRSVPVRRARRR